MTKIKYFKKILQKLQFYTYIHVAEISFCYVLIYFAYRSRYHLGCFSGTVAVKNFIASFPTLN